jgi:hypothetical protein
MPGHKGMRRNRRGRKTFLRMPWVHESEKGLDNLTISAKLKVLNRFSY